MSQVATTKPDANAIASMFAEEEKRAANETPVSAAVNLRAEPRPWVMPAFMTAIIAVTCWFTASYGLMSLLSAPKTPASLFAIVVLVAAIGTMIAFLVVLWKNRTFGPDGKK